MITLKRKIEIMNSVLKILKRPGEHYLCNVIYASYLGKSVEKVKREHVEGNFGPFIKKFLQENFPEFLLYKPKEADSYYPNFPWWTNDKVGERIGIVKDLIYRYETAIRQKKSVFKIKSLYVAPEYSYF